MRPVLQKIQRKICSRAYIDLGGQQAPTIFLAGSPRSGTTWISELINFKNQYRYIFEPFHPRHGINLREIDGRSYIRSGDSDERMLDQAAYVLGGNIRSKWVNKFNRKLICTRRFVKDVYGNLLIKWLKDNFPYIKMILVLRHPCAIASSQRNLPEWNFYNQPSQFSMQADLIEDYLAPYTRYFDAVSTPFEQSIFTWCVDNFVPLKQFSRSDIHIVLYEDFTENPAHELKRMFDFINQPYDKRVESLIKKPSMVTMNEVRNYKTDQQGWYKDCSPNEIDRAYEIMSWFGLDAIYPKDDKPSLARALEF